MAKILVIDDAPRNLDLLKIVLRRKGHEVVLAGKGRTGLNLFRQERPNVVILDFMLPDIGGLDVLKEIRTFDPNTPVIIYTGFATEEREQQVRELGVTEFINKGFSLHILGAALERVLNPRSDERRQFPRFWVQVPISVLKDGVMIDNGTGYDLSSGGCTLESQAPIRKGDYVALQLHLPDHQEPTTPVMVDVAVVRWASQQKFGLEFISLPTGDQQRLRQYVTTLQTTNPEDSVSRT
jgi:CheY-like chemotaxis protein